MVDRLCCLLTTAVCAAVGFCAARSQFAVEGRRVYFSQSTQYADGRGALLLLIVCTLSFDSRTTARSRHGSSAWSGAYNLRSSLLRSLHTIELYEPPSGTLPGFVRMGI